MTRNISPRPSRFVVTGLAAVLALALAGSVGAGSASAAEAPVGLGTAFTFGVLAGSTVTNTGPSAISGDIGVSPGTAVTGFPPGTVTNGVIHSADAVAGQAQSDVTTAFNDAAGRSPSESGITDLVGRTLLPGVYAGGALTLGGTLTLDAQNDPNAVFIFQAASTLITASGSRVLLINGADACNVFWKVGSSATLGTNSGFVGTVLAQASVTANTGVTATGRLLARTGAVTLDGTTVIRAVCAAPVPTSTPTATATVVPTGTPTSTPTATVVPTGTPTRTPTSTLTATVVPTGTPTSTPTATVVPTGTGTVAPTGTGTTSSTSTVTPTGPTPIGPTPTSSTPTSSTPTSSTPTSSTPTSSTPTSSTPTSSTPTSSTPGTTSTTTSAGALDSGGGSSGGGGIPQLPRTGTDVVMTSLAGLLAVTLGSALLTASRRPRGRRRAGH